MNTITNFSYSLRFQSLHFIYVYSYSCISFLTFIIFPLYIHKLMSISCNVLIHISLTLTFPFTPMAIWDVVVMIVCVCVVSVGWCFVCVCGRGLVLNQ